MGKGENAVGFFLKKSKSLNKRQNFRLVQIERVCRQHVPAQIVRFVFYRLANIVAKGENAIM